jgi:hypothetical protein
MKKLFLIFAISSALFAQEKLVVYVDKMNGLESSVEKALADAELPFQFIEELKQPELKVKLAKLHSGAYAEILYKKSTGRNEDHRLEMVDVKTGKTIASHGFKLDTADQAKSRIAADFANEVRKSLKKVKAPAK